MTTTVLCTSAYKAASRAKKSLTPDKKLPVTSHFLLRHHDGNLTLTPFAWEKMSELTETIPARKDDEIWAVCVPARPFTDWLRVTQVKKWEEDQIHMTLDGLTLKIKAGNTRVEFKCMDAQEFPPC